MTEAPAHPHAHLSRKELRRRWLISLGMLAGAFVLLEIYTRVHLYGWGGLSPARMNSTHNLGNSGLLQEARTEGLIYELKPDQDTWFQLQPFQTNSQGLRDREYALQKPQNTFRVAVIGDSITMGQGVRIEDCYHSVLEERLNRERPERPWEFIDFAVGGYNLRQDLAALRSKALAWQPDLILVGIAENDLEAVTPQEHAARRFADAPVTHPFFGIQLLKVVRFMKPMAAEDAPPVAPSANLSAAQRQYLEEMGTALAAVQQESGVPVITVLLKLSLGGGQPLQQTGEILRASGLRCIDTTAAILATGKDLGAYRMNAHPNAEAHAIYAGVIYDALAAERLLP